RSICKISAYLWPTMRPSLVFLQSSIFSPSLGLVAADPPVAVPHGGALQVVGTLEHRVFANALLEAQHGLLEAFFFFQLGGVGEKVGLEDAGILYHPIGGEGQAADRQLGIGDAVEQSRSRGLQLAAQVGGRLQPDA